MRKTYPGRQCKRNTYNIVTQRILMQLDEYFSLMIRHGTFAFREHTLLKLIAMGFACLNIETRNGYIYDQSMRCIQTLLH